MWGRAVLQKSVKMESSGYTGIIPRFDLQRAKELLQRGKPPTEVIAAAVRLGDDQLKRSIELFVACGENAPLKFAERREVGLVRSMRGPAQCTYGALTHSSQHNAHTAR